MRVAALVGPSGSGKTTLITALIARFVSDGCRVAAIKHTHHLINEERRGDTQRFLDAGAMPVIFAGDGQAVIFRESGSERIVFEKPRELLDHLAAGVAL